MSLGDLCSLWKRNSLGQMVQVEVIEASVWGNMRHIENVAIHVASGSQ